MKGTSISTAVVLEIFQKLVTLRRLNTMNKISPPTGVFHKWVTQRQLRIYNQIDINDLIKFVSWSDDTQKTAVINHDTSH